MNEKLKRIIDNKEDLNQYIDEFKNNSTFWYYYINQDNNRIYSTYINNLSIENLKAILILLLENNQIKSFDNLFSLAQGKLLSREAYLDEICDKMLDLDKEGIINIDESNMRDFVYIKDPLYAVNKNVQNIEIINLNELSFELLVQIFDLCKKNGYVFTHIMQEKLDKVLYKRGDILLYFLQNCSYSSTLQIKLAMLNKNDLSKIYPSLPSNYKQVALRLLNNDNYDLTTVINNEKLFLNIDGKEDEALELLQQIKNKGLNLQVILVMERVKLDFIDKAEKILGDAIKVAPLMNQENQKRDEYLFYDVAYIRRCERILDLYASTVNDVMQNDEVKHLSPLEKYFAAYIITTKFAAYKQELDSILQYHSSRSVYEFLNPSSVIDIVCVGYVNLFRELLYRMGICDTTVLKVRANSEGKSDRSNHVRLLTHLVDEKYDLDVICMSDPTWDSIRSRDSLGSSSIKHSLISYDEILEIDPKEFDSIVDLNINFELLNNIFHVNNSEELFLKHVPKSAIIKAFLAIRRFVDRKMSMPKTNDVSPTGYTRKEYNMMANELGLPQECIDVVSIEEVVEKNYQDMIATFEEYPNIRANAFDKIINAFEKYLSENEIVVPDNIVIEFDITGFMIGIEGLSTEERQRVLKDYPGSYLQSIFTVINYKINNPHHPIRDSFESCKDYLLEIIDYISKLKNSDKKM